MNKFQFLSPSNVNFCEIIRPIDPQKQWSSYGAVDIVAYVEISISGLKKNL